MSANLPPDQAGGYGAPEVYRLLTYRLMGSDAIPSVENGRESGIRMLQMRGVVMGNLIYAGAPKPLTGDSIGLLPSVSMPDVGLSLVMVNFSEPPEHYISLNPGSLAPQHELDLSRQARSDMLRPVLASLGMVSLGSLIESADGPILFEINPDDPSAAAIELTDTSRAPRLNALIRSIDPTLMTE